MDLKKNLPKKSVYINTPLFSQCRDISKILLCKKSTVDPHKPIIWISLTSLFWLLEGRNMDQKLSSIRGIHWLIILIPLCNSEKNSECIRKMHADRNRVWVFIAIHSKNITYINPCPLSRYFKISYHFTEWAIQCVSTYKRAPKWTSFTRWEEYMDMFCLLLLDALWGFSEQKE